MTILYRGDQRGVNLVEDYLRSVVLAQELPGVKRIELLLVYIAQVLHDLMRRKGLVIEE